MKPQIPLEDLNEEIVIDELPVNGQLPTWLEGTLIRNGPAKFHFGNHMIHHWFDGMAMLHAFSFENGNVSYRNKFLGSDAYLQAQKTGNLKFMGFAEDPCKSIFKRLFAYFLPSLTPTIIQNANVNVMRYAEDYIALTETPLPVRFDPNTLKTLGVLDFQDTLSKKDCFESAHPHYDFKTGEALNYQIELGKDCLYSVYTVSDKVRKPFFQMKSDKAAYMHTFALTENYVVLVEFPLVLNPIDLLIKGGGYISQFKWEPERGTRFNVIDRKQGQLIKTFVGEPFFCFHHVNAYEERRTVVIDLVRYPDPQIVYGAPPPNQNRRLERYTLDLDGSLTQKTLAKSLLELPRINYQKMNTKPYRFVYGVGFKYPENEKESIPILKIDVSTGQILEWNEDGALAGEPVFISKPDATDEDDGVLLSVILDQLRGHSYLLILDAKNLKEIARTDVIHPIPYGLHGMFYDNI